MPEVHNEPCVQRFADGEAPRFTCKSCRHIFKLTRGERTFFAKHGYQPPKRCPECRERRRHTLEHQNKRVIGALVKVAEDGSFAFVRPADGDGTDVYIGRADVPPGARPGMRVSFRQALVARGILAVDVVLLD